MGKRVKKILITTGIVSLMMLGSLTGNTNKTPFSPMVSYASEKTYSDNWKIDGSRDWRYYLNDGSIATDSWVNDYGEWYLLGSDGIMRTGLFKSNGGKYYLLDTVRGTGTYGKLLKNGRVYEGITLQCDTSSDYEGALSQETISSLGAIGMDISNVPDVQNTKHVTNGQIDTPSTGSENQNNSNTSNTNTDSSYGSHYKSPYDTDPNDYADQNGGGATGWHAGEFNTN